MDDLRIIEELGKDVWNHTGQELQQWMDTALQRMKEKSGFRKGGKFPTFTEREELASRLGKELSELLLEKNVENDSELQAFLQKEKHPCPHCQRPSPRAKDKHGKPKTIDLVLKTKTGEVPIEAPIFSCWKCRKTFSPLERVFPKKSARI